MFNTPSHHRVHHGKNPQYLDRNYAGVLMVWDRWFGTFEPEVEPVIFGLTKDIGTHNPLKIATHELRRHRPRRAVRPHLAPPGRPGVPRPGWQPATAPARQN